MRRIGWRRMQRPLDHGSNLIVVAKPAWPSVVKQAITAIVQESAEPLANAVFVEAELGSGRFAWQAIRTSQDRAASLR